MKIVSVDVAADVLILEVTCVMCEEMIRLQVSWAGFKRWQQDRVLIQDALPDLLPADRELMMSETCEPCFDELFGEDA